MPVVAIIAHSFYSCVHSGQSNDVLRCRRIPTWCSIDKHGFRGQNQQCDGVPQQRMVKACRSGSVGTSLHGGIRWAKRKVLQLLQRWEGRSQRNPFCGLCKNCSRTRQDKQDGKRQPGATLTSHSQIQLPASATLFVHLACYNLISQGTVEW